MATGKRKSHETLDEYHLRLKNENYSIKQHLKGSWFYAHGKHEVNKPYVRGVSLHAPRKKSFLSRLFGK
jgi:hypothetical protein